MMEVLYFDRRVKAYSEAIVINQEFLDETFRGEETQIQTIGILTKTVDGTTYTLRFSDRSTFVGNDFYYGRAKFPDMRRTVGELVAPTLQFSEMEVQLNNVDGFYNRYLSTGADYFSFIGANLVIKVGILDLYDSYFTIFDGFVPDEDGFSIERETITLRARDRADQLNKASGLPVINITDFPSAPLQSLGKIIPMVLGDWEAGYSVIANAGTISVQYLTVNYNVLVDSPTNFYGGIVGYNVGGSFFLFSIGTYTPDTIAQCHIRRGNNLMAVNFINTPQDASGYWVVQVSNLKVSGGGTIPYVYQDGDIATLAVKIPYAVEGDPPTKQYSNPIRIAKEILMLLGNKVEADFDSVSWTALMIKSTPAQSDMTSIKARLWIGEEKDKILDSVLSLLEQVRVELYWDSLLHIALRSLHPEDFYDQGSFRIEQIYVGEDSIKVTSDTRNFFNVALANFAFTPITSKTTLQTKKRKNQNSITKSGKEVTKAIDIPFLYDENDVLNQLDEFIRLYSSSQEYVEVNLAWPVLLNDLTDLVRFFYKVGSINYDNVPMKIRDITFVPSNACFNYKMLSFTNFPYDGAPITGENGWNPSNAAKMLSSQNQTIEDF